MKIIYNTALGQLGEKCTLKNQDAGMEKFTIVAPKSITFWENRSPCRESSPLCLVVTPSNQ